MTLRTTCACRKQWHAGRQARHRRWVTGRGALTGRWRRNANTNIDTDTDGRLLISTAKWLKRCNAWISRRCRHANNMFDIIIIIPSISYAPRNEPNHPILGRNLTFTIDREGVTPTQQELEANKTIYVKVRIDHAKDLMNENLYFREDKSFAESS